MVTKGASSKAHVPCFDPDVLTLPQMSPCLKLLMQLRWSPDSDSRCILILDVGVLPSRFPDLNIRCLDLSYNGLGDNGAQALGYAIAEDRKARGKKEVMLEILELEGNKVRILDEGGWVPFGVSVQCGLSIGTSADVTYCLRIVSLQISDMGGVALGAALFKAKTLGRLNLGANDLGHTALHALSDSLMSGASGKRLYLTLPCMAVPNVSAASCRFIWGVSSTELHVPVTRSQGVDAGRQPHACGRSCVPHSGRVAAWRPVASRHQGSSSPGIGAQLFSSCTIHFPNVQRLCLGMRPSVFDKWKRRHVTSMMRSMCVRNARPIDRLLVRLPPQSTNALCTLLRGKCSLKSLKADVSNSLQAAEIARAMRKNFDIVELDIGGHVDDDSLANIERALARNRSGLEGKPEPVASAVPESPKIPVQRLSETPYVPYTKPVPLHQGPSSPSARTVNYSQGPSAPAIRNAPSPSRPRSAAPASTKSVKKRAAPAPGTQNAPLKV